MIDKVLAFKYVFLFYLLKWFRITSKSILKAYLNSIVTLDVRFACKIRVAVYRYLGARIGERVIIKSGVTIDNPEQLVVGNDVSIQQNCMLSCIGGLTIGNDVSIAHNVSILTSSHGMINKETIRKAKLITKPVYIGSNVWIGCKSTVLLGRSIGDCVVIGAHSLVTEDIPSNSVAFGIPAKVGRQLGKD